MTIQEALALFVKEECKHLNLQQRRNFVRSVMQAAIMNELHRPAAPCTLDIAAHVDAAKERLKRPKYEKIEYTPPHGPEYIAPRLITPPLNTKSKEQDTRRSQNRVRVAAQCKAKRKDWGKSGHSLVNLISRAQFNKLKFEYDKQYAS